MEGLVLSHQYALERGGAKRLDVRHTMGWDQVEIREDGRDLASTDADALKDGGLDIALHDNTLLHVWLDTDFRGQLMFFATRDGKPLPGTAADPQIWIHGAAAVILIASIPQVALGIGLLVAGKPALLLLGAGLGVTALGIFAWAGSFASLLWGGIIALIEIGWFLTNEGTFHDPTDWLRLGVGLVCFAIALIRGLTAARS